MTYESQKAKASFIPAKARKSSKGLYYLILTPVKNRFPTQLKSKKVEISKEKMSQMIVKEKLSERAVMKENGLGQVYLQERRMTPKGT